LRSTNPKPSVDLALVGRLGAPFGVRGEIKCRPASSGPEAFAKGRRYLVGNAPDARTLVCASVRRHQDSLLLLFEGIASPEEVRLLTNASLYAGVRDIPLEDGEYLDRDLIDCELVDPEGRKLGRVVDVQHFPAQDCLVIDPGRQFVPLVKAFVRAIDLSAHTIEVDLPDGLLE